MGRTRYRKKHRPTKLEIKNDDTLVAASDQCSVKIERRCKKCGDFLSLDRKDYRLKQATCRRGCCSYGWEVEYIGIDTYCKDCYENREPILRDRAEKYIRNELSKLSREVKEIKEKIKELEDEKEYKILKQHALARSTEDFLLNKEKFSIELPEEYKGSKIEEVYEDFKNYKDRR